MQQKYLICDKCKKILMVVKGASESVLCCNREMTELTPGHSSKSDFALNAADEYQATYEYCNMHGLWKESQS